MDDKEIVSAVRAALVDRVGQDRFDLWFGATRMRIRGDVLTVTVGSQFAQDWLRRSFRADIEAAAQTACGRPMSLEFRIDAALGQSKATGVSAPSSESPDSSSGDAGAVTFGSNSSNGSASDNGLTNGHTNGLANGTHPHGLKLHGVKSNGSSGSSGHSLSRRKFGSFGSFVVGRGNQVAHSSAKMVAENPGCLSPLLFTGSTASGKTLLLECIWTAARQSDRRRNVVYLSAEQFTTYFVEALRSGGLPSFRHKYRAVDLLIIDDLQFLVNKKATLVELLHTIDQLQRDGKQLVFAADRSPAELGELGPELTSRLSGGMVCPIDAADQPTRLGIVKKLAIEHELDVPEDVQQFIATNLTSHARELSGAINRLKAFSLAHGKPVSKTLAEKALREMIRHSGRLPRLDDIARAVSEVCGVMPEELQSSNKERAVSTPRMLAMWLARKLTRAALTEIGSYFGGRSHSTVLSAQKKVNQWMLDQDTLKLPRKQCDVEDIVRQIEERLRAM